MLNKTIFTILSLFFCLNAFSQDYFISGAVKFQNLVIEGAKITDTKTGKSTTTNEFGIFHLPVDTIQNYEISVEYIGYSIQIINFDKEEVKPGRNVMTPTLIELEPIFETTFNDKTDLEIKNAISRNNLIQNAAPTLPDAMSQVSGVWLSRPNYMNNAISIRGMTGNRNTVYLDGIPLNHSMLSNRPEGFLNLVNMFEVQSIHVSKGGSTVSNGDGSLGGSIYISTTSPDYSDGKTKVKAFGSTRLSNSNEFLLNGGSEISAENFAIRYGLSVHSIGNIGNQSPTGYDQLGGNLKGIVYLNRSRLEFGYNGAANIDRSDINANVDDLYLDDLLSDQNRQMAYVKFNKVARKGPFRIIKAKVAYQRFHEQIREPLSSFSSYNLENTNNNGWLNLTGTSNLGEGWKMISGVEYKQEFINSYAYRIDSGQSIMPIDNGTYFNNPKYYKASLYNIHYLEKGDWNLEFGARGNWMNIEGYTLISNLIQVRPLSVAGNFKAAYRFNNKNQIIGSVNSNYRTPTFEEFLGPRHFQNLIGSSHIFNPNSELVTEKSLNFELTYCITTPRFNSQLSVYRTQLIDAFTTTSTITPSWTMYQQENVGTGYIRGIELDIDVVLTSFLKLTGNLTSIYGRDTYENLPMRYIPPTNGMLNLFYSYHQKLTASLTYQFAGTQTRNAPSRLVGRMPVEIPVASWNILNFSIGYQFKKVNISGGVRNIFDSVYRLYGSNIDEYRRNLWFGLRYNM